MATSAFRLYDKAKKNMLAADLDLNAGTLRAYLCRGNGASNYALSVWASVYAAANRVSGGAYTNIGKTVNATLSWGASNHVIRFDSTALVWSATGGSDINSIACLVIGISNGKMLGWVRLTTAAFDLANGNTLTVTPSATGWFELTGGTT